MEIRNVQKGDDLLAISRVYEESWKAAYREILPQAYLEKLPVGKWVPYLRQEGRYSLILIEKGQMIGVCSYGPSRIPQMEGWGELISIYLLPGFMGKGYGKALFSAALEELEKLGFYKVFLWVLEENLSARRFYQRMGFAPYPRYMEDTIGGKAVREIQYRLERPIPRNTLEP